VTYNGRGPTGRCSSRATAGATRRRSRRPPRSPADRGGSFATMADAAQTARSGIGLHRVGDVEAGDRAATCSSCAALRPGLVDVVRHNDVRSLARLLGLGTAGRPGPAIGSGVGDLVSLARAFAATTTRRGRPAWTPFSTVTPNPLPPTTAVARGGPRDVATKGAWWSPPAAGSGAGPTRGARRRAADVRLRRAVDHRADRDRSGPPAAPSRSARRRGRCLVGVGRRTRPDRDHRHDRAGQAPRASPPEPARGAGDCAPRSRPGRAAPMAARTGAGGRPQ
jgi:hypothetical protein